MNKLPISAIIVARQASKTIESCLESVQKNNPAEIVIVDGNSSDSTVEIGRRYTTLIVSDNGKGLTFARQLGAEQATQEYLAYIDSDVILGDNSLTIMLSQLQSSSYVWINAQLAQDTKCLRYWDWAQCQHELLGQKYGSHRDYLSTVVGIVRREVILKYKFDTSDSRMDDMDLEIRLKKAGYHFSNSSAIYYKIYEPDFKSFTYHRYFYGQVSARYMRKYGLFHIKFWLPLSDIYWFAFCIRRGKPKLLFYFIWDSIMETLGILNGLLQSYQNKRE